MDWSRKMIRGVSHIGIGVKDLDNSLKFYRDFLGFRRVLFDYAGALPGMDGVTGKDDVKARIVMLANDNVSPVAGGMIKLVELLPPHEARRPKIDYEWGNIGIAEVSLSVCDIEGVYRSATLQKGVKPVLPPMRADPLSTVAYVRDPDGILIEFGEWHMYKRSERIPTVEGVNHVAIGVRDMDESMAFYSDALGFKEQVLDYTGDTDNMAAMLPSPNPRMRIKTISNRYKEGWLELFQHLPPYKPPITGARWGDIGHMEFAIDVSNIEKVYEQLRRKAIHFLCRPQTVDLGLSDQWKYAYMVEPSGLFVSLFEY